MNQKERDDLVTAGVRQLEQGDVAAATRSFAQVLRLAPDFASARYGLRSATQRRGISDKEVFCRRFRDQLQGTSNPVQEALPGWLFAELIDGNFLNPALKRVSSKQPVEPLSVMEPLPNNCTATELLSELSGKTEVRPLYQRMQELVELQSWSVLGDSFVGQDHASLSAAVVDAFGKTTINVVILGAGPVGLTLANALKLGMGPHIEVLVIENRVFRPHVKRFYSRNWLTNIELALLNGVVSDVVTRLLGKVGQPGWIGVPINVLETLLLLANKSCGVRFAFDANPPLDWIGPESVDLLFDATGGRFLKKEPVQPKHKENHIDKFSYGAEACKQFAMGAEPYGIQPRDFGHDEGFERLYTPTHVYPLHKSRPARQAMVKLTRLPMALLEPLLQWAKAVNADSRFYIWPGTLQPEINELLVIINLKRTEYEALAQTVCVPTALTKVLEDTTLIDSLDQRIWHLWEQIIAAGVTCAQVEPPFLSCPRVVLPNRESDVFQGVPRIGVGDSVFMGNPKAGNGLSTHLKTVRSIHDVLLASSLMS